jgi:cytidylate kinase
LTTADGPHTVLPMARPVICIARVPGAGAADVGKRVAEALGFQLVDNAILQLAAVRSDVSVDDLVNIEQRGAQTSGDVSADQLQAYIRESIDEAANHGNLVIMSHAASIALAGRNGVLRVLVSASPQVRAGRIAEERGISETDASALVAADDDNRRDYLQRFYGIESESPLHYDMVLNSDVLPQDVIVDVIIRAARAL